MDGVDQVEQIPANPVDLADHERVTIAKRLPVMRVIAVTAVDR